MLDGGRDSGDYQQLTDYLPHVAEVAGEGADADQRYARNEAAGAYVGMGRLEEACEVFGALYRVCQERLGDRDPTTLAALVGVGAVEGLRGRYRAALELKTKAHIGLVSLLGKEHPDTLTARNNVAVAWLDLHEPGPAEEIFTEVYRARRKWLGPLHTDTMIALGNVAVAATAGRKHLFSLRLRQVVYQRLLSARGESDVLVLEALNNLGCGWFVLGDRQVAAGIFAQVRDGRRRVLGDTHPETLAALANLGVCQADPALARAMISEAYRGLVFSGSPGAPVTQRVLHNLLCAENTGTTVGPAQVVDVAEPGLTPLEDFDADTDRRVALFERACAAHEVLVARLGPEDPATMVALCHLAHATAVLGQVDQQLDAAVVLICDAADGLAELLGATHPDAVLAGRLRRWIDDLHDDAQGPPVNSGAPSGIPDSPYQTLPTCGGARSGGRWRR